MGDNTRRQLNLSPSQAVRAAMDAKAEAAGLKTTEWALAVLAHAAGLTGLHGDMARGAMVKRGKGGG